MLAATNIDQVLDDMYQRVVTNMVKYRQQGSGRTLVRVNYVDMTIYEFDPTRAGLGDHAEILSKKLRSKAALVDVLTDEKDTCFKWSFIAARKNFEKDCTKEDLLPFENEFNFESLEFPVDVYCDTISKQHTFRKFEIANDTSVNIYTIKNYERLVKANEKKKKSKEEKKKKKELKQMQRKMIMMIKKKS